MNNWIGIIVLVVTTIGSVSWLIYELAKQDIVFSFLETGDIKFVDHGQKLHKILYDTPGFQLTDDNTFVALKKGEKDNRRPYSVLGIYCVGLYPFAKIHKFKIVKQMENPTGKNLDTWIINKGEEDVSSLRFNFPRPYAFPNVELGDKDPIAVNLLAVAKFEVVDPVKMIYGLKGKFFENAGGILNAEIADTLNNLTFAAFLAEDKGETGTMSLRMKSPDGELNKALISQVGLRMVGIAMQYDPAHEALREAMEAKTIAVAKGEGTKATADADYHKNIREAQAKATERELRIKATLSGFGGNTEAATKVLVAEARPNVTTEVTGGATPVVPIGGKP